MSKNIYLDDQGGGVMNVVKDDVAPCLLLNAAKAHGLIVCQSKKKRKVLAFTQNTRDEVRVINGDGQIAGTLDAEPGTHQTTYLFIVKKVPRRTKVV